MAPPCATTAVYSLTRSGTRELSRATAAPGVLLRRLHRVALRTFGTARRAVIATLPLTAAMLVYTAVSLAVLAEPMVKLEGVPAETQLE